MSDETQDVSADPLRPLKVGGFSMPYRNYVLLVLTLIYVVNWIDRYVFAILLDDIQRELQVSNTVMGLLTGTAFGLFYAVLGVPLALLADRTVRIKVIAWCLGLFSVMTALCGAATTAWQFAILRVGVGVGEAGTSPPSHSILADLFPPKERATAMAILAMGLNAGIFIAFFFGGWIAELWGWRWAFFLAAAPGILLFFVARFGLREPPRGHADGMTATGDAPKVMEVFAYLWKLKTFRHLALAAALTSFVGYGALQWVPKYLIVSHGMSVGEVGTALAFVIGVFGGLGTFAGGMLVDKLSKGDARWNVWVPAGAITIGVPFGLFFYLSDSTTIGIIAWTIPIIGSAIYLGPALSVTQGLASLKMRALASATLLFVINIIGLGLGPLLVGVVADILEPTYGVGDALRYSLAATALIYVWAVAHFLFAAKYVREDLATVATLEGRAEA